MMAQHFSRWWTSLPRTRQRREHNDNWRTIDPEWANLRDAHLSYHPRCAARSPQCDGRREVHHVGPKRIYPELHYHAGNLITLCEFHHLALGHGGDDFWHWVPGVRSLAAECMRTGTTREILRRAEKERIQHRIPVRVVDVRSLVPSPSHGSTQAKSVSLLKRVVGAFRRLLTCKRS